MSRVGLTLMAGLALLAIALVVTLSGSPMLVAQSNATPADEPILEAKSGAGACQDGEVLPAHTSAIRLILEADAGPRVTLTALSGTRVLTSGVAESAWTGAGVTVPVRPVARAVSHVRICFSLGQSAEEVVLGGSHTSAAVAAIGGGGHALPGRFTVEYMRSAHSSWWSLAQSVARHIGLGRAPSGGWVVLLLLTSMAVAVASASRLLVRELR
jgi:hypothetical protein